MPHSRELPVLYVEGETDKHTIIHLLLRHGVALNGTRNTVRIALGDSAKKNDQGVLDAMKNAAKASTDRPVGFVIDANGAIAHRWQAVRDRLGEMDLLLPPAPPHEGFVGESTKFRRRIGVWIMPDNITDAGNLESLVRTLVPPGDTLFVHAATATTQAVSLDRRFQPQDQTKAELYCWLAWQREPGMSFGMALKAKFLRHDSEAALRFVAWFQHLFAGVLDHVHPI